MAVEMIARLVHRPSWRHLLESEWSELEQGLERRELRDLRPEADKVLNRSFDIDLEADILDWMEPLPFPEHDCNCISHLRRLRNDGEVDSDHLAAGMLQLADWASAGEWRCIEGRGYLYIEPYCGEECQGERGLYRRSVWEQALERIRQMPVGEFGEAVVLDWMQRREQFGETLEADADAHILPTMQSHLRHTEALHHLAIRLQKDDDLLLLVGRDWSSATDWGFGDFNLKRLLHDGLPESEEE